MKKIILGVLISCAFFLSGQETLFALEVSQNGFTYAYTLTDGLVAEHLQINSDTRFYLKQRSRNPDTGRVFYNNQSGKLSAEEFQSLQNAIQDVDLSELEDTYNDCGQDVPYDEVGLSINTSRRSITIYESIAVDLKGCSFPKPPENLNNILQQLKALFKKYSVTPEP